MSEGAELTILMQGNVGAVREAQRMLEQAGVRAATRPVPGKEWLAVLVVATADVARARAAYEASLDRLLHDERARSAVNAAERTSKRVLPIGDCVPSASVTASTSSPLPSLPSAGVQGSGYHESKRGLSSHPIRFCFLRPTAFWR